MKRCLMLGMMVLVMAAALASASAAESPETPATPAPVAVTATYESLAKDAARTRDVATLLAPFVDRCDGEKREVERARCRATQAYLRRVLPRRTFVAAADDAAVISVSDYDAGVKGYRLALAGCLACTKPLAVGRAGELRYVTVATPQKEAETLPKAVEIARGTMGFDSVVEAKRWLEAVRPLLRAELVFQPADAEWSFGPSRGYALKLVGGRIYNRCTGEVLVSRPPSAGLAERPPGGREEEGCGDAAGAAAQRPGSDDRDLPEELSKAAIADAMGKIRPQVFACYEKFQVPGNAQLAYVIAGNGMVQSIRVGGAFDGTPTGACVLEAGKNARFPRFKAERQQFSYPFFLRR